MPIIGKLIKKTTAISYKRNFNKGKEYTNQLNTLEQLLEKAQWTRFGQEFGFSDVRTSADAVEAFQSRVPITDYDKFYKEWLRLTIAGERDHTWPGRIKHFALSSGTTGSPSKRIPVTEEMIRSFQKTSLRQISTLHELDLPEELFSSSILAVGGCTKLTRKKAIHILRCKSIYQTREQNCRHQRLEYENGKNGGKSTRLECWNYCWCAQLVYYAHGKSGGAVQPKKHS